MQFGAMKFGVGQSVRRREDVRFITGQGRYTDDVAMPGQVHAVFVRSPHAHAAIKGIDIEAAAASPGVLGVLTHADIQALGGGITPFHLPFKLRDGTQLQGTPKTLLAGDKARWGGEAVAMVVAETAAQAKDAADLVMVDYDPLPACANLEDAVAGKGPRIWDQWPSNLAFDWAMGDEAKCNEAFSKAAHVTRIDVVQNRIIAAPIEPRAAIGSYDKTTGDYVLHTCCQGVRSVRHIMADGGMTNIPEDKIRVLTEDVGGGFGLKAEPFVEQALVLLASKKFERPVKWTCERAESFLADNHARDMLTKGELALDKDGKILAIRVTGTASLGAYITDVGPMVPTVFGFIVLGGVYKVPTAFTNVKCYFTNAAPTAPYRGAGRPETAYLMDRLMDKAAHELGLDRVEIRRRNLTPKAEVPFKNAFGLPIDSGDFHTILDDAVARADWNGFAARKRASEAKGKKRGIGICYYIEIAGGPPVPEKSTIHFTDNGAVEVFNAAQSTGQGHETTFAQVVAAQLGVPYESVYIRQGDTALPFLGHGSVGSRSLQTTGTAITVAGDAVIEKGKQAAGHVLQAGGKAVSFTVEEGVGTFSVAGTGRAITTGELAMALKREKIPGFENGLDSEGHWSPKSTFPNGCHICEVEVDPDTGKVEIARYTVVDDLGRVINPMVVAGQVQGGVAQGLGQVLMEHCIYDKESGQILTASFVDYAMPRAEDVPNIDFSYHEILCTTNPLGSKGAGEAGTVGVLPSLISAISDALGVVHIDMPATPEKIWRAAQAGSR